MKKIERIASPSNPTLRLARAVMRTAKRAKKEGLFAVEGLRLAEAAADSGWQIRFALFTERGSEGGRAQALIEKLHARETRVYLVSDECFAALAETDTPQGVLLVAERSAAATLEGLPHVPRPLYVALDRIRDPGNVGVILRTADAAGASGAILLHGCADIYGNKLVRATMGALFHMPFVAGVGEEDFLHWAAERSLRVYAAACDPEARAHFDTDFSVPAVVVLGNEANGVSPSLLTEARRVFVPMRGSAESLNVSAAAAAILYEAVRQRDFAK